MHTRSAHRPMPSLRVPMSPSKKVAFLFMFCFINANTTQDRLLQIRGRVYSTDLEQPVFISIPTQETQTTRFPLLENHLTGLKIQPFIHDCEVVVHDGRKSHKFQLFCKNHSFLPINTPVRKLGNRLWRGDILVMRVGKKGLVVNMRGRSDARLADFLTKE
jgi:hypothetical protein